MKHILLVCASGMSTSLMVKRMKIAAEEQGFECTIEAVGNAYVREKRGTIDILMVGRSCGSAMTRWSRSSRRFRSF